jgi:hypothetical protein
MHRQSGFSVLSLLLLTVALLAGLVFAFFGGGPNIQGQLNAQKTAQLVAQAQLIVQRIAKCATDYPAGDNGTAYHLPYPKDANGSALAVSALRCPGNGDKNLWSGSDGVYAPTPITGFGAWTYQNTSPDPAKIVITSTDANTSVISQAVSKIGSATASASSTNVPGDSLTVEVIR